MSKKGLNMSQEYSRKENKMYRAPRLSPMTKERGTKNVRKAKKGK